MSDNVIKYVIRGLFLIQMQEQQTELGPLGEIIEHFGQITPNFAPDLFQCYDVEGLPCTNNALEECFGGGTRS